MVYALAAFLDDVPLKPTKTLKSGMGNWITQASWPKLEHPRGWLWTMGMSKGDFLRLDDSPPACGSLLRAILKDNSTQFFTGKLDPVIFCSYVNRTTATSHQNLQNITALKPKFTRKLRSILQLMTQLKQLTTWSVFRVLWTSWSTFEGRMGARWGHMLRFVLDVSFYIIV